MLQIPSCKFWQLSHCFIAGALPDQPHLEDFIEMRVTLAEATLTDSSQDWGHFGTVEAHFINSNTDNCVLNG
jgi:hypothetical protein